MHCLRFKISRKVPVLLSASFGGLHLTCCTFIPLFDWLIEAHGSKMKTVLAGVPWYLGQASKRITQKLLVGFVLSFRTTTQ